MSKLAPEELWRKHTLERFEAFRQSGALEKLRKEGLAACDRKRQFTRLEWAKSPMRKRYLSSRYMEWYHKCETVAQKFGLANWTVVCACLISGYQPAKEPFPVESKWPQIRVVTESTDTQFLAKLTYEAQLRGLYVIARHGSVETAQLYLNMEPPPMPSSMPPKASAFYMRVETPLGYPPQAAENLERQAKRLEKELLRCLGYSVAERLRSSPLVAMADKLRVAKSLAHNEAYDVIDDINNGETIEGQIDDDNKGRKLVGSRRNKLRKRLIKPYEAN